MDNRISLLREKILSHLQNPPTIEEIADEMNLSTSRLRQLFKSEMGISPNEYLRNLRLEMARELLEITFLRVKDIRWRIGIRDQSNLVRDFKKKYGLTPTEYRRKHQNVPAETKINQ